MSEYFEIAYSAVSNRLCLFTGTGFSKAVTDNKAPSWQGLLESLCGYSAKPDELKSVLFPKSGANPLSLEEAAQVIYLNLKNSGRNAHSEIANIIGTLKTEGDNSVISDFFKSFVLKIITTNYDKLAESLCGEAPFISVCPGLPLPRRIANIEIYHVHGSIDSPDNMVVTSEDYFKFINAESYFSKKLSTTLHENTVVILGYSLGDTNLKAILSDYMGFSRNHVVGSTIFLVSRDKVDRHIKDYYSYCYGIRVIDDTQIHEFFSTLNYHVTNVKGREETSVKNIKKVLEQDRMFTDEYLKTENSFYEIISSITAIGSSINNKMVTDKLDKIIDKKIQLTNETGAWEQYTHLAKWLIYLACRLELEQTSLKDTYLNATKISMGTMSKALKYGYSWKAFKEWDSRWSGIIPANRKLIRDFILDQKPSIDATGIVTKS